MKEKMIKVCPHCASTNITFEAKSSSVWDACRDYGFGKGTPNKTIKNFPEIKKSDFKTFKMKIKTLRNNNLN